ncbi:MAG: GatB/YqeY domain-containing protein [Candidatus Omnitrophica bacterium]|nr:GatB/YqeY domain-containing protein [Candidatus Omnitrophota bacterium]
MLEDKILADFKDAMKKKESLKIATLSFLRSQLKNIAIEKKEDKLDDSDVIAAIKKQVKQRFDSIDKFKSGGRRDLVEKEQNELEILKSYLPKELSREEIEKVVDEVIVNIGANTMKDMGKVIKEVISQIAGRADNKLVSELIKSKLIGNESGNSESK